MSLLEEIVSGFQAINITLTDNILAKCVNLCDKYDLTSEEMLDAWLAYSASSLNGAPPTLATLDKLERRDFIKQKTSSTSTVSTPIVNTPPARKQIEKIPVTPIIEKMEVETIQSQENSDTTTDVSKKFAERKYKRVIQVNYGKCDPNTFKTASENGNIPVKILNNDFNHCYYMYDKVGLKQEKLIAMNDWIIAEILNNNPSLKISNFWEDVAGPMTIPGRIFSDTPTGRLDQQSLFLELCSKKSLGEILKLNVNQMENVSLFSGQIVVVKGRSLGETFIAEEIHSQVPFHETPEEKEETDDGDTQLVVACGPFTLDGNVLFEPLQELLDYVLEYRPNFLVLIGPFITKKTLPPFYNQTFSDVFESLVAAIMSKLAGIDTQVILVPSDKDMHNIPVFPGLPFQLENKYEKLILAPNPAILQIGQVKLGMSSVDVLLHLKRNELVRNKFKYMLPDYQTRLISHLLNQRSFYPLFPPDRDVRIDHQVLYRLGMLDVKPDLMILPSNLQFYAKKIAEFDCVAINPHRLSRGQNGGSFARIEVRSGVGPISDRISCQILQV